MRFLIAITAVIVMLLGSAIPAEAKGTTGLMFHSNYVFLSQTRFNVARRLTHLGIPAVAVDASAQVLWTQSSVRGEDPSTYMTLGTNPFLGITRVAVVEIHYQEFHGGLGQAALGELIFRTLGRGITIGDLVAYGTIRVYDRRGEYLASSHFAAAAPVINRNYAAWERVLAEAVTVQVTNQLAAMLR
jgi:hypothetical protein